MRTKMGGPNAPCDPSKSTYHIFEMSTGLKKTEHIFVDYLENPIPW
jgi:hypothetical protein